jgi:hypothetical protein
VTPYEADSALAAYAAGIEAELSLLRQLHEHAVRQRDATTADPPRPVENVVAGRDRLMAGLLEIESQLRPLRDLIAGSRNLAATRPAFREASTLHRVAARLVQAILGADEDTLSALRAADAARRTAAQALEAGGHTLAAYRRVIAPPSPQAALVDERG